MVLHHVPHRAGFVVVAAAPLDAERLGDGDLHMVDMRGVPQGFEQAVGEAERHQVLHRFLAEIVVDAEDAAFEEDGAELVVDDFGAGAVVADRLLDDDPRTGRHQPLFAEALRHRAEEIRTGREIEGANTLVRSQKGREVPASPPCSSHRREA